jgi:hypothetical protein
MIVNSEYVLAHHQAGDAEWSGRNLSCKPIDGCSSHPAGMCISVGGSKMNDLFTAFLGNSSGQRLCIAASLLDYLLPYTGLLQFEL